MIKDITFTLEFCSTS